MLIWHVLSKGQEYAFARPAFQAMKLRKVALKASAPREYGKAGPGRDYWIKEIRHREMEYVKRAEDAYAKMVTAWRQIPPKAKKDLLKRKGASQHHLYSDPVTQGSRLAKLSRARTSEG